MVMTGSYQGGGSAGYVWGEGSMGKLQPQDLESGATTSCPPSLGVYLLWTLGAEVM